jgi:hypothetical protein
MKKWLIIAGVVVVAWWLYKKYFAAPVASA